MNLIKAQGFFWLYMCFFLKGRVFKKIFKFLIHLKKSKIEKIVQVK